MPAVFAVLLVYSAFGRAEDDEAKVNELIFRYARQLDVGTVHLNWNEQPEVKKIRALSDLKRTAAILAIIWNLASNDEEILSKMKTNDYQVLISMLTRIHAYTFLNNLVGATPTDLALKQFLDDEVAELKLVFARKTTVAAYMQARKTRDDKHAALLKDQKFVSELVKFRAGKETVTKSLANATTMLALIEACTSNPALCVKMETP